MTLSITDMWGELKQDIKAGLTDLLQNTDKNKELSDVFSLMLLMLNTVKIKQSDGEE